MKLTTQACTALARQVIEGNSLAPEVLNTIANAPAESVFSIMAGADLIRQAFYRRQIHLCTICNGKSGKCTEDCSFCAQSESAGSDIDIYPLLTQEKLCEGGSNVMDSPVNRYAIVTSGKRLARPEVAQVAAAISTLRSKKLSYCVSLGILDNQDFKMLKNAGVSRYHHNLETARSHFTNICTTHTYDDRVQTIKAARKAGMSVCAGGLFGAGESMEQVLELALDLKNLDVDAVPVNFLTPIAGTRLENHNDLTPLKCLKIISLIRFVLPAKDILVCGGREYNLKMLHPMIFHAGASGMMTGSYLTTRGIQMETDLKMLHQIGFKPRCH